MFLLMNIQVCKCTSAHTRNHFHLCISHVPSHFPLFKQDAFSEDSKNKSWFNKDNLTISLHDCLIYWLIVVSFLSMLRSSFGLSEQKCSSHARTTSGRFVRETTDRVSMILDHIRIAGLSSSPLGPAAQFIIPALCIPTGKPTPEHKLLSGTNPKTHGR